MGPMQGLSQDQRVRIAAFEWLTAQVDLHGDVLPHALLQGGFSFEATRVPLLSMPGIFKPRVCPEIPLSIRTSVSGPYEDIQGPDGLLRYRYRGTDAQHRDNVGLRKAMTERVPLIYLFGVDKGRYLAMWPAYIVGDEPDMLTFKVAIDAADMAARSLRAGPAAGVEEDVAGAEGRRLYITASVRVRVHQHAFRERVLRAYRKQCALCRLRHEELLDAAHIIPDAEPEGEPKVSNGLALCKLHHAAFDRMFIGIRPDYVVEVRRDVLDEKDGPMLIHGLKGFNNRAIWVPRSGTLKPDPERLEKRYEMFKAVS